MERTLGERLWNSSKGVNIDPTPGPDYDGVITFRDPDRVIEEVLGERDRRKRTNLLDQAARWASGQANPEFRRLLIQSKKLERRIYFTHGQTTGLKVVIASGAIPSGNNPYRYEFTLV